jgi:hypothetical protein
VSLPLEEARDEAYQMSVGASLRALRNECERGTAEEGESGKMGDSESRLVMDLGDLE